MAEFDPNSYLEEDFNPEQYLAEKEPEKIGAPEAALRGGSQGLLMDYADELYAKIKSSAGGKPYKEELSTQRERFKEAERQQPLAYKGAQFGGAVAPWLIPTTAGARGLAGAYRAVKEAPILGGAAMGAVQATGASEKEGTEALGEAPIGAAIGGAFGAGAKVLGNVINPEYWREVANSRALHQLGGYVSKISKHGVDKSLEAGELARKSGALSTDTREMVSSLGKIREESGKEIGNILKATDNAGVSKIDVNKISYDLLEKHPLYDEEELIKLYGFMTKQGDKLDLSQAQLLKNRLGQLGHFGTNYQTGSNEKVDLARSAYNQVKNAMEDAVERGQTTIKDPNLLESYLRAKKNYGASDVAEDIAERKLIGELGNKPEFGMTDTMMLAGGVASGDPAKTVMTFGGKKAWEKYGNIGMSKFAGGIEKIGRALGMGMLGKYTPVLQNAASKGPQSLAVTHFVLGSRDPEYQSLVDNIGEVEK